MSILLTGELMLKTVNFEVYPSTLIGTSFKNVRVIGLVDHTGVNFDAAARHANVYSTLPPGTVNDFTAYMYLKVQLASKAIDFVGIPWIKENTLTILDGKAVTVVFPNSGDATTIQRIRDMCLNNGFNDIKVTVN